MIGAWADLEVFLAVHRAGSLSGAAKLIGVDQSTVSRRLAALEELSGCLLFSRSKTGVHPTAVADRWRPLAERAEAAIQEALVLAAAAGEQPEGEVRVALPEAIADFMIAPATPELLQAYPRIELTLDTRIDLQDLAKLEADLAIRFVRPETGDLLVKRLGSTELKVYGRIDYLRANEHTPIDALDWISWSKSLSHLPESRWLARFVGCAPRVRCNRATTIVAAVRAGAGVALLPERFAQTFPELMSRPTPGGGFEVEVWMVRPRVHQRAPHVEAVASWLGGLFDRLRAA